MSDDVLDTQSQINYKSLQYLLQELVPTSIRVSAQLQNTSDTLKSADCDIQTRIDTQLSTQVLTNTKTTGNINSNDNTNSNADIATSSTVNNPNTADLPGTVHVFDSYLIHSDETTIRIDTYGYNLGLKIAEILLYKNSKTKILDTLDIMKFICRDVWKCFFDKQMDNLRTNHRGTYVLVDNNFKLITTLNSAKGLQDTVTKAKAYLWFPCGVIRGILMSFGVEANVSAEITQFPAVIFNVRQ